MGFSGFGFKNPFINPLQGLQKQQNKTKKISLNAQLISLFLQILSSCSCHTNFIYNLQKYYFKDIRQQGH